ncbi:MAG: NAD-dependent epimerase/dehydratase family protein [Dehalococcoidia bacterium]|nr:NAD-dependent epimerase/dehydratase family protein [Dehalococcoidia bacterium]
MRILIAGGAGFVGSHLCERLLEEGHVVICMDNLLTSRRSNIETLIDRPGFEFMDADIVKELPPCPRLDRVYHLASPASPPAYCRYPIETLRANSEGTRNLLDLAARDGALFLYTSSSEVYGDPLQHPQHEEYRGNVSPTGPRSMYDEAKRYGEAITAAYSSSHRVSARIVRVFNTYGPGSDPADGRMIPNFITQALRGGSMTVYGDGSQTRSVCYVADIVAGLVLAMEVEEAEGKVFNLGNPEERTVLEYAKVIRRTVGSDSRLIFVDQAVGDDPRRRRPDIARARNLLGWEPRVSLSEGLSSTIAYFRGALNGDGRL